jgi:invasion protein IalB
MKLSLKRVGAVAMAGALAMHSIGAFAQSPAQPPAAAPSGPLKVDLLPTQNQWTKVCGEDQGNKRQVCYTTRDFGQSQDQPPVLALAVYDVKGEEKRILRLLLPVALMLKPGFRFFVDQGSPQGGAYAICFPNGCFAEAEVNGATVTSMKKGTTLSVLVRNQVGNEVTFTLPLAGFGKAFDGAPIDPKVLEAQQKEVQRQLEQKAKDEREKLEKQMGGAPTPAPAAPAPAPAPAPQQ